MFLMVITIQSLRILTFSVESVWSIWLNSKMSRIVLYNKCKNIYGTLYLINSNISSFDTLANSTAIRPNASTKLILIVYN